MTPAQKKAPAAAPPTLDSPGVESLAEELFSIAFPYDLYSTDVKGSRWRPVAVRVLELLAAARSTQPGERAELLAEIAAELDRAYAKHGRTPWGRHEFYAILKEEVDELWDAIKADEPEERITAELRQVAAMCFRYFETRRANEAREPDAEDQ